MPSAKNQVSIFDSGITWKPAALTQPETNTNDINIAMKPFVDDCKAILTCIVRARRDDPALVQSLVGLLRRDHTESAEAMARCFEAIVDHIHILAMSRASSARLCAEIVVQLLDESVFAHAVRGKHGADPDPQAVRRWTKRVVVSRVQAAFMRVFEADPPPLGKARNNACFIGHLATMSRFSIISRHVISSLVGRLVQSIETAASPWEFESKSSYLWILVDLLKIVGPFIDRFQAQDALSANVSQALDRAVATFERAQKNMVDALEAHSNTELATTRLELSAAAMHLSKKFFHGQPHITRKQAIEKQEKYRGVVRQNTENARRWEQSWLTLAFIQGASETGASGLDEDLAKALGELVDAREGGWN
ncbi:hypothetical protein J8273_1353 [Carpediemonas membranifera]|uniref:Uncharacterized protein n=1 Tax=Carpediemonas membranifera TaxID=201153 RepID=A0A8J6BGG7_9EUKA|nr:hypothetical protein J8273_1353 [Carpediemonas membranifera]|eukprot:KAG9397002.1 hypothetical protein J8273_1353 [Carpediemonas membranifera]